MQVVLCAGRLTPACLPFTRLRQMVDSSWPVSSLLTPATLMRPDKLVPSAFLGHLPLGAFVVEQARPRNAVVLGSSGALPWLVYSQAAERFSPETRVKWLDAPDDTARDEQLALMVRARAHEVWPLFSTVYTVEAELLETCQYQGVDLLHLGSAPSFEAYQERYDRCRPRLAEDALIVVELGHGQTDHGAARFFEACAKGHAQFVSLHDGGLGLCSLGHGRSRGLLDHLFSLRGSDLVDARTLFWQVGAPWAASMRERKAQVVANDAQAALRAAQDGLKWERTRADAAQGQHDALTERARVAASKAEQAERLVAGLRAQLTLAERKMKRQRVIEARAAADRRRLAFASRPVRTLSPPSSDDLELVRRSGLFDMVYYARQSQLPPNADLIRHFFEVGERCGLRPNPLFDPIHYLTEYEDVAQANMNALLHYIRYGEREGRRPNPLFDPSYYCAAHADLAAGAFPPLLHYLRHGWREGRRPHPDFDTGHYLRAYDLEGMGSPLEHFLDIGGFLGHRPSADFNTEQYLILYPELVRDGINPLVHFVAQPPRTAPLGSGESLTSLRRTGEFSPTTNVERSTALAARPDPLDVICVYAPGQVAFITTFLIPQLQKQDRSLRLHVLNYESVTPLLASHNLPNVTVVDWTQRRDRSRLGFGEAINCLIDCVQPRDAFLLMRADAYPKAGCLDALIATYDASDAALVEAKLWPDEHPKEYDAHSHETPWATTHCCLVDAAAFKAVGGFDPVLFSENEDVDLCWRLRLAGRTIVYEPRAVCCRFSDGPIRDDLRSLETYYRARNFLVLSYKYFGERGEAFALQALGDQTGMSDELKRAVCDDFFAARAFVTPIPPQRGEFVTAAAIKVVGFNRYHESRV